MASRTCTFVPPYLLRQIASGPGLGVTVDAASRSTAAAARCASTSRSGRRARRRPTSGSRRRSVATGPAYTVHTAGNTATLPGTPVRTADQADAVG